MKMFCTNCGNELSEGAAFCTACGKKVEVEPAQPEVPVQQEAPQEMPVMQENVQPAPQPIPVPVPIPVQQQAPVQQYAPVQQQAPMQQYVPMQQQAPVQMNNTVNVVGTGYFFGMALVYALPIIGWIVCIVTCFAPRNKSRKNYALSVLIWKLIGLLFLILLYLAVRELFETVLELFTDALGLGDSSIFDMIEFY